MRPLTALCCLLLLVGLTGCFKGSGSNSSYNWTGGATEQKFFTLTWFTATLSNGEGTADGTVTVSWPGGTAVLAPNYPTYITIPANVVVTVTATPGGQGATVTWNNIVPGSIPNTVTFYMSTNLSFGCTFNSLFTN